MHAKDKGGEKHQKRAAQKNIKEKRAAKRAKKRPASHTEIHITSTSS
ncbi:MAG: hypothetical protein AB1551_00285 [Actinomycetota bacterium]